MNMEIRSRSSMVMVNSQYEIQHVRDVCRSGKPLLLSKIEMCFPPTPLFSFPSIFPPFFLAGGVFLKKIQRKKKQRKRGGKV